MTKLLLLVRSLLQYQVLYVIHKMNNPKGMVRGDGGFTEGDAFCHFFRQGGCHPPAPPLNSSPEITYFNAGGLKLLEEISLE